MKCFRCGYKWVLSEGALPDTVSSCPSCRSRKWDELPRTESCRACGRYFVPSGRGRTCPACLAEPGSTERRCGLCGMEWVSRGMADRVCPGCGLVVCQDDASERLVPLWDDGTYRLCYLFKDAIGCVYLWEGRYPVCCEYMDKLIGRIGVRFETFLGRAGQRTYDGFWENVVNGMLERKDDYKGDIQFLTERLKITSFQAEVLALHISGMGPEVLSIRLGVSLKDIRKDFTIIQSAFDNSGILVNDSVYTDDPLSLYGRSEGRRPNPPILVMEHRM
ncbi:MAG: hypothetical protein IJ856_04405 [Candidatus Methanomethylophilaceae archaeon]|nr:hypothetical protein [Candidatus Methanomethylophilaceae archaeon]